MINEYYITPTKISVIPNAVDPDLFNPNSSKRTIREKYNLNGDPVIIFVGSFKPGQGLENIILAFKFVLKEVPNVKLLLVGDGPSKAKIERMAEAFSQNVIFVGQQPQERIQSYIAVADICVYFPNYNVRKYGFLGDPIKFYEYMAMEKPVVTTKIKNFAHVLEREKCGVLVEPDHKKFADAVVDLINNPEKARKLDINGRKAILENYNWEKSAGMLINTYGDIAEATKKGS